MDSNPKFILKTLGIGLVIASLSACGGGGGSGGGNSHSGGPNYNFPPSASIPADVDGLTTPNSADRLLYFTQADETPGVESGLFSYHPLTATTELKDADLGSFMKGYELVIPGLPNTPMPPLIRAEHYDQTFLPFHGAVLNGNSASGLGSAQILYGYSCSSGASCPGYQRIGTSTAGIQNRTAVSSAASSPFFMRAMIQYDLENPLNSSVLHTTSENNWRQFRLHNNSNAAPLSLSPHLIPVSPIHDNNLKPKGYLVVDASDENTLKFVDMTLTLAPGAVTHNGVAVKEIDAFKMFGHTASDNGQYLMLGFENDENDEGMYSFLGSTKATSLWKYSPANNNGAGTIELVLNAQGEKFSLSRNIFSEYDITLPMPQHIATSDNAIFLLRIRKVGSFGSGGFEIPELVDQLVRIQGNSWQAIYEQESGGALGVESALLVAGENRIAFESEGSIYSFNHDGTDKQHLHFSSQEITTPILGTDGHWIYYNGSTAQGTKAAIALRLDGSQRIDMTNWQWIGSSIAAEQSNIKGRLNNLRLSEVFMVNNNGQLAALDAADPTAGKVNFGALPNNAKNASLFGTAPGPHRLLQTTIAATSTEGQRYEVIYIDTSDKTSLKVLSENPSEYPTQRPVSGF